MITKCRWSTSRWLAPARELDNAVGSQPASLTATWARQKATTGLTRYDATWPEMSPVVRTDYIAPLSERHRLRVERFYLKAVWETGRSHLPYVINSSQLSG